jgi:hypothetical protein
MHSQHAHIATTVACVHGKLLAARCCGLPAQLRTAQRDPLRIRLSLLLVGQRWHREVGPASCRCCGPRGPPVPWREGSQRVCRNSRLAACWGLRQPGHCCGLAQAHRYCGAASWDESPSATSSSFSTVVCGHWAHTTAATATVVRISRPPVSGARPAGQVLAMGRCAAVQEEMRVASPEAWDRVKTWDRVKVGTGLRQRAHVLCPPHAHPPLPTVNARVLTLYANVF